MKKAGTRPAFVPNRSGLLAFAFLAFGLLLCFALLLFHLLLAVFFAVLLVHLPGLGFRLLVHLLVLRDRGEAHGRKHRRNEDCNELLHRHPLLSGCIGKTGLRRSPLPITRRLTVG